VLLKGRPALMIGHLRLKPPSA